MKRLLANVNDSVSEDDWAALRAVAVYADRHRISLDPAVVARIAKVGGRHDAALILRVLDRACPSASADQIVDAFLHLGQPYNRITNSQDSFELAFNDVHDRLLKVLQGDWPHHLGFPRIPKRRYSVTVL